MGQRPQVGGGVSSKLIFFVNIVLFLRKLVAKHQFILYMPINVWLLTKLESIVYVEMKEAGPSLPQGPPMAEPARYWLVGAGSGSGTSLKFLMSPNKHSKLIISILFFKNRSPGVTA